MEFTFPMREEDCGKSPGMVAAKAQRPERPDPALQGQHVPVQG